MGEVGGGARRPGNGENTKRNGARKPGHGESTKRDGARSPGYGENTKLVKGCQLVDTAKDATGFSKYSIVKQVSFYLAVGSK